MEIGLRHSREQGVGCRTGFDALEPDPQMMTRARESDASPGDAGQAFDRHLAGKVVQGAAQRARQPFAGVRPLAYHADRPSSASIQASIRAMVAGRG